jgi:two-component system alkaline phosphatase synthesis response regulator PhoP
VLSEKPSVPAVPPIKGVLLCIDDAVPVLEVLTCVLEDYGYSVIVAPSGRLGLAIFQAKQVDLVILDHEMPDMSGNEVALEMRRLKPNVPIIMHSAYAEIPEDALNAVDAVVSKGASYRPLVSEIDQIMAASRMAASLV